MTDRLQQAFGARADGLPRETQTLLLVTALNDKGDVGEIVAAARLVSDEIADEHLAPAAAAGLLRIRSGAVEFRHPLIRSAVHGTRHRGRNGERRISPSQRLWSETLIEVSGIGRKLQRARTK